MCLRCVPHTLGVELKRVGVFVDVSNLYLCLNKKFNKRLDYAAFLEYAIRDEELYRAYAYGAQMENEATNFMMILEDLGYTLKYKRPEVYFDGEKEITKADWDVGITVDVLQLLPKLDVVVLGTGDGDFVPLVEHVKRTGTLVHVIGCNISHRLVQAADIVSEIEINLLEGR